MEYDTQSTNHKKLFQSHLKGKNIQQNLGNIWKHE